MRIIIPNHIVCFRHWFFLRGRCNTWDDPSVFRSLDGSPEDWRPKMLDEIPAHLSRRYSWSLGKSASLPRGTVFLKRKKQFAVCTVLVQQTVGAGIHCFDRDCQDTVLRQPRYAKHATTVEIPPQTLGKTQ